VSPAVPVLPAVDPAAPLVPAELPAAPFVPAAPVVRPGLDEHAPSASAVNPAITTNRAGAKAFCAFRIFEDLISNVSMRCF
jgi:hypothetical protein